VLVAGSVVVWLEGDELMGIDRDGKPILVNGRLPSKPADVFEQPLIAAVDVSDSAVTDSKNSAAEIKVAARKKSSGKK